MCYQLSRACLQNHIESGEPHGCLVLYRLRNTDRKFIKSSPGKKKKKWSGIVLLSYYLIKTREGCALCVIFITMPENTNLWHGKPCRLERLWMWMVKITLTSENKCREGLCSRPLARSAVSSCLLLKEALLLLHKSGKGKHPG